MKTESNKHIDCVAMVRKERERITTETEGRTPKEILAYFKRRAIKVKSPADPSTEK
jgi:hypothetical protein